MKQIIRHTSFIILLLALSNCKKESIHSFKEGKKLDTISLSDQEKSILVPYNLNDTLLFSDSLNNIDTMIVHYKDSYFYKMYKNGGTNPSTDYYEVEQLTIELKGQNSLIRIELSPPLPYYITNTHINKNFLSVYFLQNSQGSNSFNSYLDTSDFYYNAQGNSIPFYSSLSLNNKNFNNVYELINNNYWNTSLPKSIYYKFNEGVMGYELNSGLVLNRQ